MRRRTFLSWLLATWAQLSPWAGSSRSPKAVGFDFYVSPTGDDVLGDGSLARPWSLIAIKTKVPAGKRVGLLPGTYQFGTTNRVQTSFYSILQEGGELINPAKGTATSPTFIGSSDASGNYSPRTAIIDVSQPGTACAFSGSISGSVLKVDSVTSGTIVPGAQYLPIAGALPAWIGGQLSGTPGGAGTYQLFPFHYTYSGSMTTVAIPGRNVGIIAAQGSGRIGRDLSTATKPTEGYITVAGIVFRHMTSSAVWAYQCIGITIYDCEFGPARLTRSSQNPGAVFFSWCDGCNIYNNKFHDICTQPPITVELDKPASGMWTGGTLVEPWPLESSIPANSYVPFAVSGQVFPLVANWEGLLCTYGSRTVKYQWPVTLAAAPANGTDGLYHGGTFIGPVAKYPHASADDFPLVLSTGQVIRIGCTQGSSTFTCNPPVAINPGTNPGTAATITGVMLTGKPSTTLTVAPSVVGPWGGWLYIQIPGGFFVPNSFHHNTSYRCPSCPQKDYVPNCINFYNNYVEVADFGVQVTDSATVNGVKINPELAAVWFQGTGPAQIQNCHHNIIIGGYSAVNMMGGLGNQGIVNITNNTVLNGVVMHTADPRHPGIFNLHNNIVYWTRPSWMGPGMANLSVTHPLSPPYVAPSSSIDGNCYQDQMIFGFGTHFSTPGPGTQMQKLSGWQNQPGTKGVPANFVGYDKNSHYLTKSPFATTPIPVRKPADIQSYALNTAWAQNPALKGGVNGAMCGALDGTVDRIGCDF